MSILDTVEGIGRHNTEREELEQRGAKGREEGTHGPKGGDGEHYRETEAIAGRTEAGEWLTKAAHAAEETMVRENLLVCFATRSGCWGGPFVFILSDDGSKEAPPSAATMETVSPQQRQG